MTTIENICQLVCAEFGVTYGQLVGSRRVQPWADARAVAVTLAIETGFKSRDVESHFNRCRTALVHAKRKVRDMRDVYPAFSHKLEVLRKQVRGGVKICRINRQLEKDKSMHYKNGREAHNGDIVMMLPSYGAPVIGVLYNATAGNDYCNGSLAPVSPNNPCPNLKECLHIDDVKDALDPKKPE